MAADVITLLEATNSWIDPNLKELAVMKQRQRGGGSIINKKNNNKNKKPDNIIKSQETVGDDKVGEWDNEFAIPNPRRVVLKRASHVSDASSSEDENEK
eukprot:CAMPEP_0202472828 /NCGR_PEP_ID=MMETSP1360-20130828/89015_1 /ASSEMBLY_ACC=CAM_ASM_000848 /TAXON_ID=515479 /ORGANISM="Licmophora paradoxa, Strain CCMP2313" /LENGTH=98 /DNA_ID=CAMNT_0049099495 /DNA_START=354 /DNA_END=650 /DNA_ORIENTATION=+